jgi:hypothetical protein
MNIGLEISALTHLLNSFQEDHHVQNSSSGLFVNQLHAASAPDASKKQLGNAPLAVDTPFLVRPSPSQVEAVPSKSSFHSIVNE